MDRKAFDIQPIGRFYEASAAIRRPKVSLVYPFPNAQSRPLTVVQEIACFSYDDEHKFHLGDSSMKYYYPPCLPADLNRGFESFQKLDDSADEHLDALLETVMALEQETQKKCEADIITWRGMMTKVDTSYNVYHSYGTERYAHVQFV